MERRDGVRPPRALQGQDGHREVFVVVVRVDPAEAHQGLVRDAEGLPERPQVLLDQLAAGNRSWPAGTGVCVVKTVIVETRRRASPKSIPSVSIRTRIISRPANALCPSLRWRTPGWMFKRPEGPDPADAEQQLLADSNPRVPAVEPGRELAVLRGVGLDVGVEQEQGVPPDRRLPDPGRDRRPPGRDGDRHRGVVPAEEELQGQDLGVDVEVVLVLPTRRVEPLAEVPLGVKQPDPDEGDAQVGRALDVVAGQDAEARRSRSGGSRGARTPPRSTPPAGPSGPRSGSTPTSSSTPGTLAAGGTRSSTGCAGRVARRAVRAARGSSP